MKKFEVILPASRADAIIEVNGVCYNYLCPDFNATCPNVCPNIKINHQCGPIYDNQCKCVVWECCTSPSNPQCDISGRIGRPGNH